MRDKGFVLICRGGGQFFSAVQAWVSSLQFFGVGSWTGSIELLAEWLSQPSCRRSGQSAGAR